MLFLKGLEGMNTTYSKLKKHVPVNGWMAICQRDSRFIGAMGAHRGDELISRI